MNLPDPLLPVACEVISRHQNSADVFTVELQPPPHFGAFRAGQFNMLYLPGAGESAISISGDPADRDKLVHTIRAVGNITELLMDGQKGDSIGLRGPFGRGWPIEEAYGKDLLILAGGIGLAPLRPVLYQAVAQADRFRSINLLVGARSPMELLYVDQLMNWKKQDQLRLQVTVDSAAANWRGDVGVITELIPKCRFDPERALAMICGPEIMIRFSVSRLLDQGMSAQAIHVSLERNMQCATGFCGHCQLGPHFLCKDGPVFSYPQVEPYLLTREF